MEIYTLLRKGELHKNYCEDFLFTGQYNDNYRVFAVFDGCSSGRDAHFASALMGKCLQASLYRLNYSAECNSHSFINQLVYQTLLNFRETRDRLMLGLPELLTSLIVFVYSTTENVGEIIALGDGFISVNGTEYSIDQQNEPDYPAYHLDKITTPDDLKILVSETGKRFHVDFLEDISISTDGIFTFELPASTDESLEFTNPLHYLVHDRFLIHNQAMLPRKCNVMKNKYRIVNQDDIALIRIIKH